MSIYCEMNVCSVFLTIQRLEKKIYNNIKVYNYNMTKEIIIIIITIIQKQII